MAEPLTLKEAVRFLDRVYAIALERKMEGSLVHWVSVADSKERYRVERRGICRSAIRDVNDNPNREIFSNYPGNTDDLYYQAALDAVLPEVNSRAQAAALATLFQQQATIGDIQRSVRDPKNAKRLNVEAVNVKKVGDVLDLPVTVKTELPALTAAEAKQVVTSGSGNVLSRLRRTIYIREVRRANDSLLFQLVVPPNGVALVDGFAKSIGDGQRLAENTFDACKEATLGMQTKLQGELDYVWKFPPALGKASANVAQSVGRPDAAMALTKLSLAWATHKKGAVESALDVANNAILALGLLGPVGAVASDILGVVLSMIGAVVSVLDEMDQDQAAVATTFADDGDKLSKGGRTNVAALKGVASILAAAAPLGLSRILGRTARVGAATREGETVLAGESRANTTPQSSAPVRSNRGLSDEPVLRPSTKAEAADKAIEAKSLANKGVESKGDAPSATSVKKARGTSDQGVQTEKKLGSADSLDAELDKEFFDTARRDPKSFSKTEVDQARRKVVEEFERLSQTDLKPLKYQDVALPLQQKETFGRLTGRLFTDSSQRVASKAASEASAELLRTAESQAANLRHRLEAHWARALPRRGKQTAEDTAMELLKEVSKEGLTGGAANREIREKFLNRWRERFLRSVAKDTELVKDMRTQAGVIFNPNPGPKGNSFGVPFRDANGGVSLVGLDVDHAIVGHSEAVIDALRTGDSRFLTSAVDAKNLQLLTQRENRNFIETIRTDNRLNWATPP